MGYFNIVKFRQETSRARINSFKNIATNAALSSFNSFKLATIEQFEDHIITKEIESGPDSSNISRTLGGRGNLFSFLGFEAGQKPIDVVRQALEVFIVMDKTPSIQDNGTSVNFRFSVRVPNLQTLYDLTPLPWENGRSWLQGIERGVSGLIHYLYWKKFENPPSRSESAVQTDIKLRGAEFSPTQYMSKIINDLRKKLDR